MRRHIMVYFYRLRHCVHEFGPEVLSFIVVVFGEASDIYLKPVVPDLLTWRFYCCCNGARATHLDGPARTE